MMIALLILVAAVSGLAVYWRLLFSRLLPLEIDVRRSRGHADDLKLFSLEMIGEHPGGFPRALGEVGQRALTALSRLAPELALWWIAREGPGVVVAHRGGAWAASLGRGCLDAPPFKEAVLAGGSQFELTREASAASPFLESLAGRGIRRVRLVPWGNSHGPTGVLVVGDRDSRGRSLNRVGPFLDIARPLATSLAQAADHLQSLARAREKLQGGLEGTVASLTDTHGRLIEKSRQVKTLADVATTLATNTSQAQITLNAMVSIVAKAVGADLVAFLLLDEATGELVTQPGAYGLDREDLFYHVSLTETESSSVRAFKSGEVFVTGDAQNDPRVIGRYARLWNIHSLMVVPLKVDDRSLGVIRIGSFRKDYFSGEHVTLMTVIAREAAVIVETATLSRKLAETAEQMSTLNRMKDEFVSTVSHEFKTPLTTIMGFLTVILEGETGILTDQQLKFLSIAQGAAKRLSGLVSDLLDISRLEGGAKMDMKPRDFARLMRQSLENGQPQAAEKGLELSFDIPENLPRALCDERWTGLVLDNLISNALKFTPRAGKVRVWAADKGEFLMVCVEDSGIGIPDGEKDRIFERFYRTSNRLDVMAPGTGLGLAIAKDVVDKHGGKIWFESQENKGSKFYFVLKVARDSQVKD